MIVDFILRQIFHITGSRAVSETIWEREVARRWQHRVDAHINAGGVAVTIRERGAETTYLIGD